MAVELAPLDDAFAAAGISAALFERGLLNGDELRAIYDAATMQARETT